MSSSIRRLGRSTGHGNKRSAALAKSWPRNIISHGAHTAPALRPETLGWGGSGMPSGASHATRAPPPRAVQTLVPPTVQAQPQGDDVTTFKFDYGLVARVTKGADNLLVDIDAGHDRPVVMHWAVDGWTSPADEILPSGTNRVDAKAVQTQFRNRKIQIKIPKAVCPKRIVFVLKELEPEAWINDGSVDFSIHLRQPDFTEVVERIIASETQYTNWSLKDRMQLVMEVLDAADQAGPSGMGFIYSYLQLSQQRQLDWYRRSNYQPKDLAHTSGSLAQRVSDKARNAKDPWVRLLARLCMSGLPRGGGNGDQIRHGILDIMRRYNIKEGHRQGHDEPFLEQWHQKLHQNTSPDDITICEAYLAFLHSGYHDDYWRVLWDNGRLTKERLEKFNQPITAWPQHLPHLIGPFQHYLWILKTTHSGADLDVCAEFAKGGLDGDLQWTVFDILQHRNEWWVPGKIVDTRQRLMNVFKTPGASRDVLLLDIALEGWFRVCVERMDPRALSGDDLLEVAGIVLKGGLISADNEELRQCLSQWDRLRTAPRWTKTWALQAMATVQRTQLSLAKFMDTLCASVQPAAETLGNACKLDQRYIVNFGEEAVRSQPLFVLSPLLQALEPILRNVAGMSAWQIVSQTESAVGEVVALGSLAEVQGKEYASPVLLLADKLGGNEDIPTGVQAVITRSTTDVLSHVAIRARSQGVLLATCHDDGDWNLLKAQAGSKASYAVDLTGAVHSTLLSAEAAATLLGAGKAGAGAAPGASGAPLKLQRPSTTSAWALPESQFTASLVGRKSLNLAALRKNMPAGLKAPASVTLPLGTFERVLGLPENAAVAGKVSKLLASLRQWKPDGSGAGVPAELEQLRSLVSEGLVAPPALVKEVASLAASSSLVTDAAILCADPSGGKPGASWPALWSAICRVWASKWNDRAWLSRRARSVPEDDLFMAVLLQEVVPARYAFVLHTANPITNAPGELFGEVVAGMGEALVGSHPGRALSFCATADGTALHSLPSKRAALWAPPAGTIIARSDANGEDLEGFAGAGLYDSVPVAPLEEHPFDYSTEALMWDDGFRSQLLGKLAQAGHAVKAALGAGEQDIEGVWTQQGGDSNGEGQIFIVQARAQVASA